MMEVLGMVTTMGWAWFIVEYFERRYVNFKLKVELRKMLLKPLEKYDEDIYNV